MRQLRNFQTDRCYHLISRVAHRAFYLNEEERTRFVERMRRVAYFSCIEILAYCVMSNHFHVLVYVPAPCELSEEEVLAHVQALYTGVRHSDIMKEWCAIVKGGGASRRKDPLPPLPPRVGGREKGKVRNAETELTGEKRIV